jgi:hypothetical protein
VLAKRQTEVDFMNGAIAKWGDATGVPTPLNKAMWALIKGLEHSWTNPYRPVSFLLLARRAFSVDVPFRIGVLQLSMEPVAETVQMAQACDAAGFDTFWLAEAYPWWRKHSMESRSSTSITAIVAHQTRKIAIGWGIISPYTRHPVQIAMEARVLQDLAGEGRFLLGLGASKIFMKEIGEGEK